MAVELNEVGLALLMMGFLGIVILRFRNILKSSERETKESMVLGALKREDEGKSEAITRAMGWRIAGEVVKAIVVTLGRQALIVVLERVLEALKTSGKGMYDVTAEDVKEALCETRGELWNGRVVEDLGEEGDELATRAILEGIGLVRAYGHIGGRRILMESKKGGWAKDLLEKVRGRVFGKQNYNPEHPKPQSSSKPTGGEVKKPAAKVEKVPTKPKKATKEKKPVKKMDPQFYGDGEDW